MDDVARSPARPAPDEITQAPVLLARQPILGRDERLEGYELLFRTATGGPPVDEHPEQATSHVLTAATGALGLDELTGGRRAWVNVTRSFLLAFDPLPLAPESFVIELLEGQLIDAELLARLQRLAAEGHELALDDYSPETDPEVAEALLAQATYVKLDVRALGDGFAAVCGPLVARGLTVLAEKVETREEYEACAAAGASLFQGYFFARPRLMHGRHVPTGPVTRLSTAVGLQREDDRDVIAQTIVTDPGLSVRLLRFANSAAVGGRRPVSSVQEALIRLGARPVRQWALLVLLSEVGAGRPALLATALLRARLCERLARDGGAPDPDASFAVGLLSVSDALLDQPLEEVLATLGLEPVLEDALLHRTGQLGQTLAAAIAAERGEASSGAIERELPGAIAWAEQMLRALA